MIGIDVVRVDRVRELLERAPRFADRFFSEEELDHCRRSNDLALHLAGTIAAKEAVMKSLHLVPAPAWMRRIEISRDANGAPAGRVGEHHVLLSISHESDIAVAVAMRTR